MPIGLLVGQVLKKNKKKVRVYNSGEAHYNPFNTTSFEKKKILNKIVYQQTLYTLTL